MQSASVLHRSSPKILIVDDERAVREVVADMLATEGYQCNAVGSAREALVALDRLDPDLMVTDINMPEHSGLWLLKAALEVSPEVAVIMITGFGQTSLAVECMKNGAVDFLMKPLQLEVLTMAVERALEMRRMRMENRTYQETLERRVVEKTASLAQALDEVQATYQKTLVALVRALDVRECETSNHSQRVQRYAEVLGSTLGITGAGLRDLGRGALLHDIGKIGVPDGILLKPGYLTEDEWEIMRQHPQIGYDMIKDIEFLRPAADVVLCHQERWDGAGYPNRLGGEDIPFYARIFAVVDTLDAITSDRPYRRGQSYAAARAEIERFANSQFDPRVVEAFLDVSVTAWQGIRENISAMSPAQRDLEEDFARVHEHTVEHSGQGGGK